MQINPANIFQQVSGYCYGFDAHEVLIFVSDKGFFNLCKCLVAITLVFFWNIVMNKLLIRIN